MNQKETGLLISKLRKEAGYTQKQLADALFVTDKAISKWERGICLPDSSLLTRLSMLLDTDIEYIINGKEPYGEQEWVGILSVNDLDVTIAGKPLINYLLSYFMLVGIKDIYIISNNEEYIRSLKLEKYGLNIYFSKCSKKKAMLIYDKFFLFGVNLTRQFQYCMNQEKNISLTLNKINIPIIFTSNALLDIDWNLKHCDVKLLGRGTIYFLLHNNEDYNDMNTFISIYEKHHNTKIADLFELAKNRNYIK